MHHIDYTNKGILKEIYKLSRILGYQSFNLSDLDQKYLVNDIGDAIVDSITLYIPFYTDIKIGVSYRNNFLTSYSRYINLKITEEILNYIYNHLLKIYNNKKFKRRYSRSSKINTGYVCINPHLAWYSSG